MPHPSFTLWRPVIHDGGRACSFDAVAMTARHLRYGSPDLIADFLAALNIEAIATRWSLRPFRSPFYGRPEADHWDDRLPLAWRIAVSLAEPLASARVPFDFAGTFTNAYDSTAADPVSTGFEPPNYETGAVIVIAVFTDAAGEEVTRRVAAIGQAPSAIEVWPLSANLTELRVTIEPLTLPEQEDHVASAVTSYEDAGGICHWTMLAAYTER
jgi:hypothetical protein